MSGGGPVIRLATRSSPLALWQARRVADLLTAEGSLSGSGPVRVELVKVDTVGDRRLDVALHEIGGQGVFVKEVQAAVLDGRADAAVHSAKDLPSDTHPGLSLAAIPERADARDVLVGASLSTLTPGARIATGSVRRRAQLANLRPDLSFCELRGNLGTRVARLSGDDVTAIVVAKAALDRLGWEALGVGTPGPGSEVEVLAPELMVPQVAQGALAVECRGDDERMLEVLSAVDDAAVHRAVLAERSFLAELGGGCTLPIGAYASPGSHGGLDLAGLLASGDGRVVVRHSIFIDEKDDPASVGRGVARYLLDEKGGSSLGEWFTGVDVSESRT